MTNEFYYETLHYFFESFERNLLLDTTTEKRTSENRHIMPFEKNN